MTFIDTFLDYCLEEYKQYDDRNWVEQPPLTLRTYLVGDQVCDQPTCSMFPLRYEFLPSKLYFENPLHEEEIPDFLPDENNSLPKVA